MAKRKTTSGIDTKIDAPKNHKNQPAGFGNSIRRTLFPEMR